MLKDGRISMNTLSALAGKATAVIQDRLTKGAGKPEAGFAAAAFVVPEALLTSSSSKLAPAAKTGPRRRLSAKTSNTDTTPVKGAVKKENPNPGGRSPASPAADLGVVTVGVVDNLQRRTSTASPASIENTAKLDVGKMLWGAPLGVQLQGVPSLAMRCSALLPQLRRSFWQNPHQSPGYITGS
jgi:hypothetical protein